MMRRRVGAQAVGRTGRKSAAPCPARHDVAPGRLEPSSGSPVEWCGPVSSPWTRSRPAIDLLGLLRRPATPGQPCRASQARCPRAIRKPVGAVRARSTPTRRQPTTAEHRGAEGRAARWTKDTPRPRSAAPWRSNGIEVDPRPSSSCRGKGALGAHVQARLQKRLPQELKGFAGDARDMRRGPTASSRRSSCHNTTPASSTPAEDRRAPPSIPFGPARSDRGGGLCIHEERTVWQTTDTVTLQAPGTSDPRPDPPLAAITSSLQQGPRPRIPRRRQWTVFHQTAMSGAIPRGHGLQPSLRQPNPL